MGKSDRLAIAQKFIPFLHNGQSYEGRSANEGHEEEEGEQGWQEVRSVQRDEGKDCWWLGEECLDEEQERQDREQEAERQWQEGLCWHQGLDCCCPEGEEGPWFEGLHLHQEGHASLQEGQGALHEVSK